MGTHRHSVRRRGHVLVFASLLAILASLAPASGASAQNGTIAVIIPAPEATSPLHEKPVLVSLIQDGELLMQQEILLRTTQGYFGEARHRFRDVAPGSYMVRVDGPEVRAQVTEGVRVLPQQTRNLHIPAIEPGEGDHVRDFTGLFVARLERLPDEVDALREAIEALRARVDEVEDGRP